MSLWSGHVLPLYSLNSHLKWRHFRSNASSVFSFNAKKTVIRHTMRAYFWPIFGEHFIPWHKNVPLGFQLLLRRFLYFYTSGNRNEYSVITQVAIDSWIYIMTFLAACPYCLNWFCYFDDVINILGNKNASLLAYRVDKIYNFT